MKHLNLILIAFSISFLSSCYPYDPTYTDELDLTMTLYDDGANFSEYKTFTIRDSVILIGSDISDKDKHKWYDGNSIKLRDAIKDKFVSEGYTFIANSDPTVPDFYVNNLLMLVESTSYYYPGWWYGYPGYYPWYPYWKKKSVSYGYYPGYPGYYPPYYYTTTYGTVYTEMIDMESLINSDENNPIDILWQVFVNGVASGDLVYDSNRVSRGYNEAFEQSPYLK